MEEIDEQLNLIVKNTRGLKHAEDEKDKPAKGQMSLLDDKQA